VTIIGLATLTLYVMGRSPICPCGTIRLWHGLVQSDENSQQIADWYSLSHIVHGLIFYSLGWLLLRRQPIGTRFLLALIIEAGWEVLENSPLIIDRYRAVTMTFGYSGDSILNSVSDMAMMALGFWLAAWLPRWGGVALAILLELIALAAIRDNLTLNVLMLIAPNDAVRVWQQAGQP
jgi:hypothetical protein